MNIFKYFLVVSLFMSCIQVKSQTKVYIFKDRYKNEIHKTSQRPEWEFENIKILLRYMMDPKNTGEVDYKLLDHFLNKLMPDVNDNGVICIDLENKAQDNVTRNVLTERGKPVSETTYKESEKKLITLIKYVKSKRPNAMVGMYGLPARAIDSSSDRPNSEGILDPILAEVDVLFPALYVPFEDKERALPFLKLNLDRSFAYGERLNKPVAPFFWYLLFPAERGPLRYELIPKRDMLDYIKYVQEYKSPSGQNILGIVWWDTPTQYNRKMIKQNLLEPNDRKNSWTMEKQFQYYFGD